MPPLQHRAFRSTSPGFGTGSVGRPPHATQRRVGWTADDKAAWTSDAAGMAHRFSAERAETSAVVARLIELGRDREAALLGSVSGQVISRGGTSMEPIDQLALLGPALGAVVEGIQDADLDRPTPCAGFAVRDVLEHMVAGAGRFGAAFRGEPAPAAAATTPVLQRFGPALAQLTAAIADGGSLQQALETPFGPLRAETLARYVVLDGLVHGWDVAVATGQPYDPPIDLVAAVAAFGREFLVDRRGPDTFGPPTEPPPDATPIERLAAFTGREVSPARA